MQNDGVTILSVNIADVDVPACYSAFAWFVVAPQMALYNVRAMIPCECGSTSDCHWRGDTLRVYACAECHDAADR